MISTQKIISTFAEYSVIEDDIVLVEYINDVEVTVNEAKEIRDTTKQLSQNNRHAIIHDFAGKNVIFSGLAKSMAEGRNEVSDNLYARAFVLYNISNKIEIAHFLKFHKPSTPSKVFNDFTEAINWLKEQRSLSH
ncbi:MAG TPA: hypothetical protein VNX68_15615 [Nitrosopumilaceae archaeon]|jgi:hypothetical protein|nr:hypothetical protein [Nitrosopumilaceae archaeon]